MGLKIFLYFNGNVIKVSLGIIAGVVTVTVIIIILTIFFIYKKKSDKPDTIVPNERDYDEGKAIIFYKNNELKQNVVDSTEDEQKRVQEFKKLEAKVDECITLVKMTNVSREEENAKHNRYKDIGKEFNKKNLKVFIVHF